jgi:lipopolysaccharide exporter
MLLRLANVLLTAVVARILSPHDFGVFAVALTAYVVVSSIAELGVSSCLIRADLDIDSLAPTVATIAFLSSAILAGAMVAFARPIATALGSAAAVGPIRAMSVAVLLTGVFAVPYSQMVRDFRQDKIFLANAISFVPSTVLLIVLAKSGSGAMAFAWSRVAGQFVLGGVLIATAPRHYRPGLTRSALSVIFTFGIPLAGANFVNYVLLNVDYAFVGHLMGAAALGVYMLAFTVASWPYGVLGSVINGVSMPAFSRVKHDPALLKNAMATALRAVSLVVLPMCGMSMALARPIVLTVYGAKWVASANVLVILSLYGAVSIICLLFANMLTSLGRTKFLLGLQLIWIGALVPAMALGVHKDGIVGAAYAHVAVIVPIVLPSYLLALKRVTGVRFTALAKAALPALLASSAAALAAHGAAAQFNSPLAQLAAGLAAGGLVYVICAGRQAMAAFGRGQAAERVLRLYSAAARLVGLPDGGGKHAASYAPGPVYGSLLADAARLGADHGLDLTSRANLGYAHRQADWLTHAVALNERTLADRERTLGPDHPHTLASRANLAYAYSQAGRLAKAIPLYERSFADLKWLLGADHPRTLRSSSHLAAAYREAGRLAEAIPLYERTLARCTRVLGDDHALTRTVRSNLSMTRGLTEPGTNGVADGQPAGRLTEPGNIGVADGQPAGRPIRVKSTRSTHWARRPVVLVVLAVATLTVAGLVVVRAETGLWHAGGSGHPPGEFLPLTQPAHPTTGHRHTRASTPSPPAARVLVPVSAAAFGPAGVGSGDSPQLASMAIDVSTATAWTTPWYRTAQFGSLKAGTGLLIEMSHPVRITSVRIILGSARGANLQVLTGNAPALAMLHLKASASDAGGTLRLTLAGPERARYLLIWITLLPPDPSRTFQASIYDVRLKGMP